jgi:hypothetical protein
MSPKFDLKFGLIEFSKIIYKGILMDLISSELDFSIKYRMIFQFSTDLVIKLLPLVVKAAFWASVHELLNMS